MARENYSLKEVLVIKQAALFTLNITLVYLTQMFPPARIENSFLRDGDSLLDRSAFNSGVCVLSCIDHAAQWPYCVTWFYNTG